MSKRDHNETENVRRALRQAMDPQLHVAVEQGSVKTIKRLLQEGADIYETYFQYDIAGHR